MIANTWRQTTYSKVTKLYQVIQRHTYKVGCDNELTTSLGLSDREDTGRSLLKSTVFSRTILLTGPHHLWRAEASSGAGLYLWLQKMLVICKMQITFHRKGSIDPAAGPKEKKIIPSHGQMHSIPSKRSKKVKMIPGWDIENPAILNTTFFKKIPGDIPCQFTAISKFQNY